MKRLRCLVQDVPAFQASTQWTIALDLAGLRIVHTCYAYDEDGKIILWSPVEFHED